MRLSSSMGVAYDSRYASAPDVLYSSSQPALSSTPILQAQHVARHPPSKTVQTTPGRENATYVIQTLRQMPRPCITLPAVACLLVLLNHIGLLLRSLWTLGLIDCLAIMCLAASGVLAAQHLQAYLRNAAQNIVVQVLEMTDSKVMLAKLTEIATLNPAPGHWLNMYYTMVDDIAGLHQENVKMRTIMSGMQADIEHLKSKGKYIHPVRTMYRAVAGDKKNQAES